MHAEIAVVIPVLDGARHLAGAIRSVQAQTLPPADVVVVDAGSTDGSDRLAAELGARVVRHRTPGVAAGRNVGVDATTAPLVAFLDSDDEWRPHKLAAQVAALDDDPSLGWVSSRWEARVESGAPAATWAPHVRDGDVLPGAIGSTLLARRAVLEQVGPFDSALLYADDLDWYLRSRDAGVPHLELPDALAVVRFHGGNLSNARQRQQDDALDALRASVARRRARSR